MLSSTSIFNTGKILFLMGVVGLSIVGFISNDFIISRPPAWNWGGKEVFPLILNVTTILLCITIMLNKWPDKASLVLAIMIFVINFLLRNLPAMMKLNLEGIVTHNAYKGLMFAGGAVILAMHYSHHPAKKYWLTISAACYTLFFLLAGRNHFKYDQFVIQFIPEYIPFRSFWTYFTGVALIAGGIGLLIPRFRKLAALLSAIMVFGWFIVLHIPRFIMNTSDPSDRMGLCESLSFSGALFMLFATWKEKPE